jgi:hypothetical protein
VTTAADLAVIRTDRIERILSQRRDVACVYAQFESASAPAVRLDEPEARQAHIGMIRALVTMEAQ